MQGVESKSQHGPDGKKKLAEAARHEKDLQDVKEAFEEGKENYGARQIKTSLAGKGIIMSRRKISRLMKKLGLVSAYGIPKYTKPGTKSAGTNKADVSNLLGRNFSTDRGMEFCAQERISKSGKSEASVWWLGALVQQHPFSQCKRQQIACHIQA